jgi:SAM-dependent methyltransferase
VFREIRELFAYHAWGTERFARHDVENVFGKTLRNLQPFGFGDVAGKRVLDLGCGQRMPFALQCAAAGAREVVAMDLDYAGRESLPLAFLRTLRANGLKRASKSALRRLFFDRRYFRTLERAASKPLLPSLPRVRFVLGDAAELRYPLPNQSFELIASNSVLEHVRDMNGYVSEISRLLSPGGFFHGIIHNYYSLSGGHNMEWAAPDERPSTRVPPWDHLREQRFPAFVYLNRLRPEDYRAAFERVLEVLVFEKRDVNHDLGGSEGESLLTPELERELSRFPRQLLLTRAWCLIARKKQ